MATGRSSSSSASASSRQVIPTHHRLRRPVLAEPLVVECDRHAPVTVLNDHHRVVRADGGAASRGCPKARDELCDLVAADKYRDQGDYSFIAFLDFSAPKL